ncbi:MAG TPA: sigma-70 family RNA polymerase sigma factor [Acidimicrobiales bacterium]|nr:sigma-70 family RNA polymerase sigma factor [Acidimicrobiales bacterium]
MAKRRTDLTDAPSDADLTLRATKGDSSAFEELYRRHAEAAWRVGYAVTGNPHDASDAVSEAFTRVFAALPAGRFPSEAPFRPYLLTATRNAAIDGIRRTGKLQPRELSELETGTAAVTPGDAVIGTLDASLVATAFLALPERWRSVLWLTEVEGLQPREIADMLGVTANGAAQLAVRARNGLREQFLQAHMRTPVKKDCRFTVDHLGAYVGGALSARDVAKVDQHLAGCDACRARQTELEDIGSTLRRIALPLPLGLAAIAAARWKLVGAIATQGWRAGTAATRAARPLALASGLMLALGIIGAAVVRPPSDSELSTPSRRAPQETSRPAPVVQGSLAPISAAIESVNELGARQAAQAAAIAAAAGPPPSSEGGTAAPPPSAPAPPVDGLIQLSVRTTPASTGAAAGDQCTGLDVAGAVVVGCQPPAADPAAGLITVETHGQLLGDHKIAL